MLTSGLHRRIDGGLPRYTPGLTAHAKRNFTSDILKTLHLHSEYCAATGFTESLQNFLLKRQRRVVQSFGKGWVSMYGFGQIFSAGRKLHCQNSFCNHF